MGVRLIAFSMFFAAAASAPAHAQIKVDFGKITCRQYLMDPNFSAKAPMIANWLSGYFNGKNNNTIVDIGAMARNKDKVEDYCRLNQELTLIDAAKAALGLAK